MSEASQKPAVTAFDKQNKLKQEREAFLRHHEKGLKMVADFLDDLKKIGVIDGFEYKYEQGYWAQNGDRKYYPTKSERTNFSKVSDKDRKRFIREGVEIKVACPVVWKGGEKVSDFDIRNVSSRAATYNFRLSAENDKNMNLKIDHMSYDHRERDNFLISVDIGILLLNIKMDALETAANIDLDRKKAEEIEVVFEKYKAENPEFFTKPMPSTLHNRSQAVVNHLQKMQRV